jgi:hypothetical protein
MRMWRKFSLLATGLAAIVAAFGQNAAPPAIQPVVSLTISAVQDSVKAGTPVRLKIVLANTSDHDLTLAMESSGRDYHLDVRDSSGKLAADTDLGYYWNGNVAHPDPDRLSRLDLRGSMMYGTLKLGHPQTSEIDAGKL